MRTLALAIALVLMVATLAAGTPAAAAPTLSGRLDALVGDFPGGAAIWVADPSAAQPLYTKRADEPVIAASLWKLAVLAEVERRVDAGQLAYGDAIAIEPEDVTEDGSFEAPGTELTIDEALERMITVSDNGTAMAFWRILGAGSINTVLAKSGIAGFHVAVDPSEDNIVTARAVGTYFSKLAKGQLVSKTASARILTRLRRQQINDRLPAQLPEGTPVAHKTGNLVGLVHDAGILFAPRSQRVVVALTWDTDDDSATELIAHVAAEVYREAITPPASARFSVPLERQYVQHGATLALDVDVDNIGDDEWTAAGPGRMSLVWELRDASNAVVARAPKPLPLGSVPPGGSARVPLVVAVPTRAGDAKLVVGLQDASGRALSSLGVATASVPVRIHLPFVAATTVRIPSVLHRREASLVEVTYAAFEPVRWDDHHLSLGWRFVDPSTGRVVAQGALPLGVMKTYERAGTFFAPLVAPNVRGTYVLEYELRERGFLAGEPRSRIVEVGAPRTFPQ